MIHSCFFIFATSEVRFAICSISAEQLQQGDNGNKSVDDGVRLADGRRVEPGGLGSEGELREGERVGGGGGGRIR